MMQVLALIAVALSAVSVLTGCASPATHETVASPGPPLTRNNCYSLLHQLLDQQKKVALIRFVKQEEDDVKRLIKKISADSGEGAQLLEKFAKDDPSINLRDLRLPPGEEAARAAVADSRKKELLSQTGDEFELTLLLTQAQALSYAWHMAKVAGENEAQPDRARALAGVSKNMEDLYWQVFALLLARAK